MCAPTRNVRNNYDWLPFFQIITNSVITIFCNHVRSVIWANKYLKMLINTKHITSAFNLLLNHNFTTVLKFLFPNYYNLRLDLCPFQQKKQTINSSFSRKTLRNEMYVMSSVLSKYNAKRMAGHPFLLYRFYYHFNRISFSKH